MEDPALTALMAPTPTLHASPSRDLQMWFLRAGEAPRERRAGGGICENPERAGRLTMREEP